MSLVLNELIILTEELIILDQVAKIKYNVPISLWLVEYNHKYLKKKYHIWEKVINY